MNIQAILTTLLEVLLLSISLLGIVLSLVLAEWSSRGLAEYRITHNTITLRFGVEMFAQSVGIIVVVAVSLFAAMSMLLV